VARAQVPYSPPESFLIGGESPYVDSQFADDQAKRQQGYAGAGYAQTYATQPGAPVDTSRADESMQYLADAGRGLEDQARLAGTAGNAYQAFLGQGPGPSAARAQLADATAASRAQSTALAASGRGSLGGGEAARRAGMSNAATSGQASLQGQVIAGQEDQMWRQREAEAMRGAASAYGLEGNLYGAAGDAYSAQRSGDQTQVDNIYRNAADRDANARAWDAYGAQREGLAFDYSAAGADARQAYGQATAGWSNQADDTIRAEQERRRQIQQAKEAAARDATTTVATMGISKVSDRRLKTNIRGVDRAELTTLMQALANG
jgi:hypothetical protein